MKGDEQPTGPEAERAAARARRRERRADEDDEAEGRTGESAVSRRGVLWVLGTIAALGVAETVRDRAPTGRAGEPTRQLRGVDERRTAVEESPLSAPEADVFKHVVGLGDEVMAFDPENPDDRIVARRGDDEIESDRMFRADDEGATDTMVAVTPNRARAAELERRLLAAEARVSDPDVVRIYHPEADPAENDGDGESGRSSPVEGETQGTGTTDAYGESWGLTDDDIRVEGLGALEGMTVTTHGEQRSMPDEEVERLVVDLFGENEPTGAAALTAGALGSGVHASGDDGRDSSTDGVGDRIVDDEMAATAQRRVGDRQDPEDPDRTPEVE